MAETDRKLKFEELDLQGRVAWILKERTPSPEQVIYKPTIEFLDREGELTREERGKVVAMGDRTAISYKLLKQVVLVDRGKPPVDVGGERVDRTSGFYLKYALAARSSEEIAHTSILEQINPGPDEFGGDSPIVVEGVSILSGLRDICSLRHFAFEAFSSRGGIFPEGYWRIPQQLVETAVGSDLESLNQEIYECYLDFTKQGIAYYLQHLKPNEKEAEERYRWRVLSHALDDARQVTNGTFLNHFSIHPNSALSLIEGVVKLYSSELPETRDIAGKLRQLALPGLPTLMSHTEVSPYTTSLAERKRQIAKQLKLTEKDEYPAISTKSELVGATVSSNAERIFLAALIASEGEVSFLDAFGRVKRLNDEEIDSYLEQVFEGASIHDKPLKELEMIRVTAIFNMSVGAVYEAIRHRPVTHLVSRFTPNRGFTIPGIYHEIGVERDYIHAMRLNEKQYRMVENLGPKYDIYKDYFVARGHIVPFTMRMSGADVFHFIKLRASPGAHPDISGPAFELESALRQIQSPIFRHLVKKS